MSPAFISGISEILPNSKITYDKFHIVQHLNKAMDTVRKQEHKGNDSLKNHKYTYLRSKAMFLDIFQTKDSAEAKLHLTSWCDLAIRVGHSTIYKVCKFS